MPHTDFQLNNLDMGMGIGDHDIMADFLGTGSERLQPSTHHSIPNVIPEGNLSLSPEESFSWEMIGLGLDEPLPPQGMIDEL